MGYPLLKIDLSCVLVVTIMPAVVFCLGNVGCCPERGGPFCLHEAERQGGGRKPPCESARYTNRRDVIVSRGTCIAASSSVGRHLSIDARSVYEGSPLTPADSLYVVSAHVYRMWGVWRRFRCGGTAMTASFINKTRRTPSQYMLSSVELTSVTPRRRYSIHPLMLVIVIQPPTALWGKSGTLAITIWRL